MNPLPATAKKAVSQAKGASCGLNPVVDPTAAYSPYAFQQRCAEAQLVNFDNRRLVGPRSLYVDPAGTIRSLESLPTPDMCYQECSDLLGPDMPFFANLYESGDGSNLCYWWVKCPTFWGRRAMA